jgi:DNA repair protein REV1
MFNKQMPLAAPGGRATSDDKVISDHAWRLLKSFNFDPKDLRGIGIQIQKLESSSSSGMLGANQAQLPFKRLESPTHSDLTNKDTLRIVVQPASDDIAEVLTTMDDQPVAGASRTQGQDLPSFSQVDKEVFDALPDDVRMELEAEYRRRSHSPAPISLGNPARRSEPKEVFPKITVKGTNVKRITRQLAPKTSSGISPKKHNIFRRSGISITDDELRKLDIDPEVFALLPEDMHREQLAIARQAKKAGGLAALVAEDNRERIEIKPTQHLPSVRYRKKPPPKANHLQPVGLKRPGGQKGERLSFTETDDVQKVIQSWVETYQQHPPYQRDIDFFAKFLVQSADSSRSTDTGLEKCVAVLKWWLMLLRRYWGTWEHDVGEHGAEVESSGSLSSEQIGRAWWNAFKHVKDQVDLVARKKFGGSLSLR